MSGYCAQFTKMSIYSYVILTNQIKRVSQNHQIRYIQDALKDLLGGTIKEMMEAEMDDHLGYEKSERLIAMIIAMVISKRVNSCYVLWRLKFHKTEINFEPQVVKKRKDI